MLLRFLAQIFDFSWRTNALAGSQCRPASPGRNEKKRTSEGAINMDGKIKEQSLNKTIQKMLETSFLHVLRSYRDRDAGKGDIEESAVG